jgi:hypothetical protein
VINKSRVFITPGFGKAAPSEVKGTHWVKGNGTYLKILATGLHGGL